MLVKLSHKEVFKKSEENEKKAKEIFDISAFTLRLLRSVE